MSRPRCLWLPCVLAVAFLSCKPVPHSVAVTESSPPAVPGPVLTSEPALRLPTPCAQTPATTKPGAVVGPKAASPCPAGKSSAAAATSGARPDSGSVRMTLMPETELVLRRSADVLNMILRLEGVSAAATQKRPPVDLALVIDRSGSMAGQKILKVKQSALAMLKTMRPEDHVTLISYAGAVKTHLVRRAVDDDGRALLRQEILRMEASGSTALGPALSRALRLLERAERRENVLAHVLLLSDGRANVGETRPSVLSDGAARSFHKGISLSTLGVGVDFNDILMIALATQGGGRYHFVERDDQIPAVLQQELAGLSTAVARHITVRLELAQGVTVRQVYGYATTAVAGGTSIRVGALRAGQTRNIVVSLNIPSTAHEKLQVGSFQLQFRDVNQGGAVTSLTKSLVMDTSDSANAVARSVRAEVAARVAEVEGASHLSRATTMFSRGSYDRAQGTLDKAVRRLETQYRRFPSNRVRRMIDSLKKARSRLHFARTAPAPARRRYIKRGRADPYDAFMN
ncbi:MAG: VWA domain-containing protein [bacterium]